MLVVVVGGWLWWVLGDSDGGRWQPALLVVVVAVLVGWR